MPAPRAQGVYILKDYYGHDKVCLSVKDVLGREGIIETLEIPLNEKEQKQLKTSVQAIKTLL